MGAGASREEQADHKRIEEALKGTFRPEFINRIDEIIIFEPLSEENMVKIVDLQIKDVIARWNEHGGVNITFTDAAKKRWLANQGYDKDFGARPLRRAIQRYVESPLSVQLLRNTFASGDSIEVDEKDGELVFNKTDATEKQAA